VADYFSGGVLLRSDPTGGAGSPGLARAAGGASADSGPELYHAGELRFQSLFNMIVVWMAVFIGLSKGERWSYGVDDC